MTSYANENAGKGAAVTPPPKEDPKAVKEKQEPSVSEPDRFRNDPDDPTNPNEAIERHRRKVRR